MKNKLLVIIVVAVLVIVGGGIAVYFTMNANKSADGESTLTAGPELQSGAAVQSNGANSTTPTPNENMGQATQQNDDFGRLVIKDKFSLRAPEEWMEVEELPTGILLMMVNVNEQIDNAAAEQIGFKSYLSVAYDDTGQVPQANYLEGLKTGLQQVVPGITFSERSSISIDGKQAKVLEANLSQQGISFKVLMFVLGGENKDMWVISFNTLPEKWDANRNLFYQIAESFKLK